MSCFVLKKICVSKIKTTAFHLGLVLPPSGDGSQLCIEHVMPSDVLLEGAFYSPSDLYSLLRGTMTFFRRTHFRWTLFRWTYFRQSNKWDTF